MLSSDTSCRCRAGPVPGHVLLPACPWALLQAPGQAVSPISSAPTRHPAVLTLQSASERGGLVETQIAGLYLWNLWFKTLGWAPEFVFSTSSQLMLLMLLVPWLHLEDHSSRENRFLFCAAWSVQLFYFDFHQADHFCVFSGVCKLLEGKRWFCRPGRRVIIAGSWRAPGRASLLSREDPGLKSLSVTQLQSLRTPSQTPECVDSQAGRKSEVVIKYKKLVKKGGKGQKEHSLGPHNSAWYREGGVFSTPHKPPSRCPKDCRPSQRWQCPAEWILSRAALPNAVTIGHV